MNLNVTFTHLLKNVFREQLLAGNTLELKGVGRWKLKHKTQHQVHRDNGQVVMMPPRDELQFVPEKERLE